MADRSVPRLPRGFGPIRRHLLRADHEAASRQDLARRLGVSTLTIQRILVSGEVPDFRRGATTREVHAWVRTVARLARHFGEDPARWVRGVGIPWSERVRSIVQGDARAEGPVSGSRGVPASSRKRPSSSERGSATPSAIVEVGIADLRPFVDPLSASGTFFETLASRMVRASNPSARIETRLAPPGALADELGTGESTLRLAVGVFETPYVRSRGAAFLPLPGLELELSALCAGPAGRAPSLPGWHDLTSGRAAASWRVVVTRGDPAWSHLLGQCDRRETELELHAPSTPETLGDAILAKTTRGSAVALVSDEATCRRVAAHLRRRGRSDLSIVRAIPEDRPRYRLGVALAPPLDEWSDAIESTWRDELWGSSRTRTARLYADALVAGAFSSPALFDAPSLPSDRRLHPAASLDAEFERALCHHLLTSLAGDRRLATLISPDRLPDLSRAEGLRRETLRIATRLVPDEWRATLARASEGLDWSDPAALPLRERAPSRVLHWYCDSCSTSLLEHPGAAVNYCRYCSDESGKLRSRAEIEAILAEWMQGWQEGLSEEDARIRALRYMSALPAWSGSASKGS